MNKDEISVSDILDILSAQKLMSFRALVYKTEDLWKVHTVYLENSFQRHNKKTGFLNYDQFGFILLRVSGIKIVEWLKTNSIKIKGAEFSLPQFQPNVWFRQYPSYTSNYWLATVYPFTTYNLHFAERDVRLNEFEPLISKNLPSFPNINSATFYYLHNKFHDKRYEVGTATSNNFTVQINHKECWIDKVYLEPSSISINTKGTFVTGSKLEVWVGKQHFEERLTNIGRKTFLLKKGLADNIWIVISQNNKWLDQREIDLRYRNYSDKSENLILKFLDKQVEVKGIIAQGEGETTEFKVQVPDSKESVKLTKTVAAFANGAGGIIVLGVEDSTGKIVGIKGHVEQEKVRLAQMIRNNLTHQPIYKIFIQKIDGLALIIVQVESGKNPPYGINPSNPSYYVRRGATTFPTTPDEIRILTQKDHNRNERDTYAY